LCLHVTELPPGVASHAHVHRGHESAAYIVSGQVEVRHGADLEFRDHAVAGDFVYIPAGVPHQPANLSADEPAVIVIARTDPERTGKRAVDRPRRPWRGWLSDVHSPGHRPYRRNMAHEVWAVGDAYEAYVGRWSRRVAVEFLDWLDVPGGLRWLDVGCGTGALTSAVLATANPATVVGVDPSETFLATARAAIADPRATFGAADARYLPLRERRFDTVVSALALNFVSEPDRAAAEFARVTAPDGVAAAYVWDYADGMRMMRYFWDAATALDPAAFELDEGRRFPLCRPEPLARLWTDAGLRDVRVEAIEVPTVFADFDDYWRPFLGGQGPAPGYVASLNDERRLALRDLLRERLPTNVDGSIPLTARVWAVRGS
jgi:SAM-dependent methyltransferase